MQYLEELKIGDCFMLSNRDYILTTDFKSSGHKLSICLSDGSAHWLASDTIINQIDIFKLDKDNNIIAIKPREKTNDSH